MSRLSRCASGSSQPPRGAAHTTTMAPDAEDVEEAILVQSSEDCMVSEGGALLATLRALPGSCAADFSTRVESGAAVACSRRRRGHRWWRRGGQARWRDPSAVHSSVCTTMDHPSVLDVRAGVEPLPLWVRRLEAKEAGHHRPCRLRAIGSPLHEGVCYPACRREDGRVREECRHHVEVQPSGWIQLL